MKINRIATWAYAIIIGGAIMITPHGNVIIVTNPAARFTVGVISVLLDVIGLIGERKVPDASRATKGQ